MSKIEPKFDHSKAGWKRTNNFIPGMSGRPKREYQKGADPAGLSPKQRRRIEDIKDQKTYPDDKEVWE